MGKTAKVIFSGLDEAGKTSIILTLQNNFSALNSIRPTLGLQRAASEIKFLGMELISWDLGGQKNYRSEYFKQKFRVFANVTTMFYVVDMVTPQRFEESIEYLDNILNTFTELGQNPSVIILLNKVDPDIATTNEIRNNQNKFKDLAEEIKRDFNLTYYPTSIHDPPTIIKAFSDGVIKKSPKAQLINNILRNYARLTFSSANVLLDENSLILGNHFSKPEYLEMCEIVSPRFAKAMDSLERYQVVPENLMVDIKFPVENSDNEEQKAQIFMRKFVVENDSFYLVVLSRNPRTIKLCLDLLPDLANQLQEIIKQITSD